MELILAAGSTVPAGHVGSNDAPNGGAGGDVTGVAAGNGILVANPGGPVPTVSASYGGAPPAVAAASAAGVAATLSRADHTHAQTFGGAPPAVAAASAAGSGTTASRADHTHAQTFGGAPPAVAAASAAGSGTTASRADHTHAGVASVVQGTGIIVDATDPAHPVVSLGAAPDAIIQLMTKTGTVLSSVAGSRFTYAADESPAAFVGNNIIPLRWAAPFNHYMNLYGIFLSPDPAPTDIVVTLYKNGAPTACTFTIPAGSAVGFVNADLVNSITYAAGDDWGVRMDVPVAGLEGPTQFTVGITILIVQT